jgi:hypothetical protein
MSTNEQNTTKQYQTKLHTDSSIADNKDHRLAVIRWKTPSDKKDDPSFRKLPTRCVSIPRTSLMVEPEVLRSAMVQAFEDMQDEVIRALILEGISNGDNNPYITAEQVSEEAVAAFITAKAISGRLSGELLQSWYNTNLKDKLTLALGNAMKLPDNPSAEQSQRLEKALEQHSKLIQSLASPRASMPENICKQLKKAVSLAEDDGKIKGQIIAKLDMLLQPRDVALDLGLGE